MKLFLIRHGETQENVDGIVQGWLNTKLNKTGINQAKAAACIFNEKIDAVYSSDLLRCRETAEEFRKKYPDIPYFEDKRLRERNFGDAQGTHKDLHDWEVFWSSNDYVSIPNTETLNEYNLRVSSLLRSLKAKFPVSAKILVITHGGTINRILDIAKTNEEYYPVKNCEALEIDLA